MRLLLTYGVQQNSASFVNIQTVYLCCSCRKSARFSLMKAVISKVIVCSSERNKILLFFLKKLFVQIVEDNLKNLFIPKVPIW